MTGKWLIAARLSQVFSLGRVTFTGSAQIFLPLLLAVPLYPSIFAKGESAYPTPMEDSDYYLAKILSVTNGDLMQSDAYFPALTQSRSFNFEFLGEILNGFLIKLLFGNVALGITIFLLILICLQVHSLRNILGESFISFSAAVLFFYTMQLFMFQNFIFRLINPVLPITLLMLYIAYSQKSVNRKSAKLGVIAILSMVSNVFFGATILLHLLLSSLPRKFIALFVPIAIALTFSLSWFNLFPISEDLWRWGAISSHLPGSFFATGLGILFVVAFKVLSRLHPALRTLTQLILTSLCLMNSQLVLGVYIENSSHFGTIIEILGLVGAGIIIFTFTERVISIFPGFKVFVALLIIPALFLAALKLHSMQRVFASEVQSSKNLSVAFADVSKCTGVSLSNHFSEIFPKYSSCPVLYGKSATAWFSMSNEEVMERWLLNQILQEEPNFSCHKILPYDAETLFREVFERRYFNLQGRLATARILRSEQTLVSTFEADLSYVSSLYAQVGKNFHDEGCKQMLTKYKISHKFNEKGFTPTSQELSGS